MVLAAAGEARGGREPTAAERALAAEARGRLAAAVSEGAVRPKDLFPGEAVRAVVEDLGLNRAKDPAAMGFRPPKASIADRLMLTKRKMEEVKESPVQPTITPLQVTVSSGMAEFQGSNAPPMFAVGTVRNPPAVAAMPTTAPGTSTSVMLSKPHGSSPVKPVTSPSVVALPHTGQPQLRSEKGVNGPSNLTRVTAGHLNKSFQDTSVKSNLTTVTSTNQVVRNPDTKVAAIQTVTGNPPMGHHATPGTPSVTTKPTLARHIEIAKNVQRFLRQPANNPSWTPPSTEYMHARLDCQICKVAIMDANSLLVCDACERGAHLKCLQHYGNKGVPIADWHCPTCVAQSKGKTLPPKYGKVTRTVVASQAGPPGGATQLSVQGAAGNTSANENHQKVAANGNLIKSNSMQAGSTVHNSTILALNAATRSQSISVSRSLKGNVNNSETSSDEKEGNVQPFSTGQHNVKAPSEPQSSELTAGTSSGSHSGKSSNENVSSGLSLHSVDSGKDTMHEHQSAVTSGINCLDSSFAVAAGANIRSEALPSRDVEMVNSNGTLVNQISNIDTEEKIGTEATSDVATEEKVHAEAISEPQRIKDIEMTNSTETPICQSSNIAIEENHPTGTTLEPHTIEDMETTVNTAKAMDETNNVSTEEEARSAPASAVKDVEMATNVGTATNQTQLANESTENGGRESPSGATLVGKSDVNATPDHHSTHQVLPNGVLHITGEVLCGQEGESVDCSAAPREETS